MKWRITAWSFTVYLILSFAIVAQVSSAMSASETIHSIGTIVYEPPPSPTPAPTPPPPADADWTISEVGGIYYLTDSDGTSTSSSEPTSLINQAFTSGGSIYVYAGNYLLTSTIVPKSNTYFFAEANAYFYQEQPSSLGDSISLMLTQSYVEDCTIDGGHWDGRRLLTMTDWYGGGSWSTNFFKYMGICFYGGGNNIVVKNVLVENVIARGIDLQSVTNGYIGYSTVNYAGDNPITLEGNGVDDYNCIVEYCTVVGGQDVGINTWTCNNCTIRYNTVTDVIYNPVSMGNWGIASEQSDDVSIIGNTVTNCAQTIVSELSSNIVIYGNTVVQGNPAIDVKNSDTVLVDYNDVSAINGTKIAVTNSVNVVIGDNNVGYP